MTMLEFQLESNKIEGIVGVRDGEIEALLALIMAKKLWIGELVSYVSVIQGDAILRDNLSVPGVRVGNHIAPPSGPKLMTDLCVLLDKINMRAISPHTAHCEYEDLHPFTDGNGRSGRALWLWMHAGKAPIGFLHAFYYETLASKRRT